MTNKINHPQHYNHIEGIECIDIVKHFNFNLGNAIKYIWRCYFKKITPIEDLKKAIWYLEKEIEMLDEKI